MENAKKQSKSTIDISRQNQSEGSNKRLLSQKKLNFDCNMKSVSCSEDINILCSFISGLNFKQKVNLFNEIRLHIPLNVKSIQLRNIFKYPKLISSKSYLHKSKTFRNDKKLEKSFYNGLKLYKTLRRFLFCFRRLFVFIFQEN